MRQCCEYGIVLLIPSAVLRIVLNLHLCWCIPFIIFFFVEFPPLYDVFFVMFCSSFSACASAAASWDEKKANIIS